MAEFIDDEACESRSEEADGGMDCSETESEVQPGGDRASWNCLSDTELVEGVTPAGGGGEGNGTDYFNSVVTDLEKRIVAGLRRREEACGEGVHLGDTTTCSVAATEPFSCPSPEGPEGASRGWSEWGFPRGVEGEVDSADEGVYDMWRRLLLLLSLPTFLFL